VRYKTHCDRKAHNLFLFIPPTLPSARAACVCLCSTAHKRGVCAPVVLCGGCCWWAGIHRPAAAAACQTFFYDFYKKLTANGAQLSLAVLLAWLEPSQLPFASNVPAGCRFSPLGCTWVARRPCWRALARRVAGARQVGVFGQIQTGGIYVYAVQRARAGSRWMTAHHEPARGGGRTGKVVEALLLKHDAYSFGGTA
jgi:hypothetical protein